MPEGTDNIPTHEAAVRIASNFTGKDVIELDRYETGLCHWVYRCRTASGRLFVLRVARPENRDYITGGIANSRLLAQRDIPVAQVLDGDVPREAAGFPWMIVEHVEGRDLGEVYPDLSSAQKVVLARELVEIHRSVAKLGEGAGFGYAFDRSHAPPCAHWDEVIDRVIERSLGWLAESHLSADREAVLVQRRLEALRPNLREVRPIPFLDDLTTKNVLVHEGKLSGIVDVDELCFGDRMMWVGLTRMALLSANYDTDYAEYLLDELGADQGDRKRCDFYTGLYAFVFLSEQGIAFNADHVEIEERKIERFRKAVESWAGTGSTHR